MVMKNGSVVPTIFEQALEKDTYALKVFMAMTAKYQEMCVERVLKSDEASPGKRIQSALREIHKYGKLRDI